MFIYLEEIQSLKPFGKPVEAAMLLKTPEIPDPLVLTNLTSSLSYQGG
jgi:hypothetical protein